MFTVLSFVVCREVFSLTSNRQFYDSIATNEKSECQRRLAFCVLAVRVDGSVIPSAPHRLFISTILHMDNSASIPALLS